MLGSAAVATGHLISQILALHSKSSYILDLVGRYSFKIVSNTQVSDPSILALVSGWQVTALLDFSINTE